MMGNISIQKLNRLRETQLLKIKWIILKGQHHKKFLFTPQVCTKIALGTLSICAISAATFAAVNYGVGSWSSETVEEEMENKESEAPRTKALSIKERKPIKKQVPYSPRHPSVSGMVDDMCKWEYEDIFSDAINSDTKGWYDEICADYKATWFIRYLENKQSN